MHHFNGPAYDPEKDQKPLSRQHEIIREYMLQSDWRTLAEIEAHTGFPQASISAQLRHLRKPRFGNWRIEKRRREDQRQWEYKIYKAEPHATNDGQYLMELA